MITPLKSIRAYCLQCANYSLAEVRKCPTQKCEFYPFRRGRGRPKLRFIRVHCLDCSGGSYKEVRNCKHFNCPLQAYKLCKRPKASCTITFQSSSKNRLVEG
jgi:hypothetical protein